MVESNILILKEIDFKMSSYLIKLIVLIKRNDNYFNKINRLKLIRSINYTSLN